MNYLELVQQVLLLSRISESRLSEPLSTFTGATGPEYEAIQWVAQADVDLQLHRNGWLFMRGNADLLLSSGASTLTPAAALSTIRMILPAEDCAGRRSIGCYLDSVADESRVAFIDYERWYGSGLGRGTQQRSGRPSCCTDNKGVILFDAVADTNYQITFDYTRKPQRMTLATSESLIPEEHRMVIVWWALHRYYCLSRDSTTEFRAKCKVEMDRELNRLYAAQLPPTTSG